MTALALMVALAGPVHAEDGYDLWLRYATLPVAEAQVLASRNTEIVSDASDPALAVAIAELRRGLGGLLQRVVPVTGAVTQEGALVLGSQRSSHLIRGLALELDTLGPEGFVVRSMEVDGRQVTVIAAREDLGVLYGVFHYLRLVQTGRVTGKLQARQVPAMKLRVLDHWDNLDGYVERGYAGASLWDWHKLPDYVDPRYTDYARANASIGINGAVLNNVNANALSLTPKYLDKAAALARVLRPYGVKVFLSARFSAPVELGGLATADPLDPDVQRWWQKKVDEIYRHIPDFGGLLVKANSEGQPGPQDYGRTHAQGANLLARALAPHGGVVMWRAFVYSHEQPEDRATQAYSEFQPLDGDFDENVLVQVKNGPIDFQPREPFHPLLGAVPKTSLMLEFQITKEYLGFATHLVYLGPLYEETLRSDTFRPARGWTVGRLLKQGSRGGRLSGMAGVANIGSDRNWSGSHFDQANWYAFGRLAWDPFAGSREIARDWLQMTFSQDPQFVGPVTEMMMSSRQAAVDYMTPLGLHHLMARGHHYGPGPWVQGGQRADWTSVYYHRADRQGIGFDRSAMGSGAVRQYAAPLAEQFGDPARVPEDFLLWFHHVSWDQRTRSGRTVWEELVTRYDRGVDAVVTMQATWAGLDRYVDATRYQQVAAFLAVQKKEAQWWRDASIAYFQRVSGHELPAGVPRPPQSLQYYQALEFPFAPGDGR